MTDIKLVPLTPDDRERFVTDNQEAFNFGALEEFGRRDEHFEEDGEIISLNSIMNTIQTRTVTTMPRMNFSDLKRL